MKWTGVGASERGIDLSSGESIVEIDPRYFRPAEVETLLGDPSEAEQVLFNLNITIQWVHMVAGDVRRWSECLPALFEHGSVELEFVQALAEEPFKEIDVRCPAYAEYSASSEHIHMYSFALHPHDMQPSGHFTFRNIKRPSLSIQLKEKRKDVVIKCFIVGYRWITFSHGQAQVLFI